VKKKEGREHSWRCRKEGGRNKGRGGEKESALTLYYMLEAGKRGKKNLGKEKGGSHALYPLFLKSASRQKGEGKRKG